MRKKILFCLFGFVLMAFLPLAGLGTGGADDTASETAPAVPAGEAAEDGTDGREADEGSEGDTGKDDENKDLSPEKSNDSFIISDTGSGKTVTVGDREFCIGALAYEMPPYYHEEALKAQCAACYTHFCRLREKQRSSPDPELKGAYFRADLSRGREYMSEDILREKWGDKYDEYRKKLEGCVDSVFGEALRDGNGEFIDTAYFAISSGMTENSEDVFGFESPYLRAVPSPWDRNAAGYCSENRVSRSDFDNILKKENGSYSADKGTGEIRRTGSGTVLVIEAGGVEFSGARIRELFGLRSAVFDIRQDGDGIVFTVKGYGHGVGMSQYGANAMAQQGADYREILRHYYKITSVR